MKKFLIAAFVSTFAMNTISAAQFENYPEYNGSDLELVWSVSCSQFKLWSPGADAVELRIYSQGNTGEAEAVYKMKRDGMAGTWNYSVKGNLLGKYYTFKVKYNGKWLDETPGVWAKAVSVNGARAAIIDMATTNPAGWGADHGPAIAKINDAVIYEMHHRDFSMHENSGIAAKGKFVAMLEKGTLSVNGQPTGIDHLKELGVTHVHILPSYDYNSVDEFNLQNNQYNWGYDPINYNVPDGSYSTNPACPATRIREMKMMIKALHDAGIGVIMDVVYNHTGTTDGSNFELTAPGYYYRQWPDGRYSDASGCGNETASDRPQMSNFIVNSIKYWMQEYHIDAFRFDLMAIHDIATMNRVIAEAKTINPNVFIYGEGWTAGDSPLPVEQRSLKEAASKLGGIAVFSDDIRDAVKGHYSNERDCGFASGKAGNEETVKIGIVGATAHPQVDYKKGNNSKFAYASSPLQVINYVSCHDDLCLTDKLAISMEGASLEERMRVARLAQTIVFTSQGTPFMFAGEEVFRDKKRVHNSYKSPDSINAIDWNQKLTYREHFDYYRNLIAMRKNHPAFRLSTAKEVAEHIVFDKTTSPCVISYSIKGNAGGDEWNEVKLVFNGNKEPVDVVVPKGKWTIVAQDGKLDQNGLGESAGGKVTVAPRSATILVK